jgi:hypothetical protein
MKMKSSPEVDGARVGIPREGEVPKPAPGRKLQVEEEKLQNKHYVKTLNRSRDICNGPLTPVISTHICNGCCLVHVTYKRVSTTPGLASTTPVTNVDFW